MRFGQLLKIEVASPVILLLRDGSAAILTTADPARNIVWLKDPRAPSSDPPVAVDELRLSQVWSGETLLIRAIRDITDENAPFSFLWVWGVVRHEHKLLRDMFFGSFALSLLTLVPPLIVMTTLNRVLTYRSISTLALVGIFFAVALLYETLLELHAAQDHLRRRRPRRCQDQPAHLQAHAAPAARLLRAAAGRRDHLQDRRRSTRSATS